MHPPSIVAPPRLSHIPSAAELAGARVVIWGAGSHGGGIAAGCYCQALGAQVAILEQRLPAELPQTMATAAAHGWPWHIGNSAHPVLRRCDLILASPAIPPRVLARLPAGHPPVLGCDALFFAHHRGARIAVTGTKGKSTTANACGVLLDRPVGGNSHRPLLDLLRRHGPDAGLVCELSSFQLWYLQALAPRIDVAVITNLSTDHLDWHPDVAHYRAAKLRLLDWATVRVHHPELDESIPPECPARPPEERVRYDDHGFHTGDGTLIAERAVLRLPGEHNAANIALALSAVLTTGLGTGIAGIRLAALTPLPHRLETIHRSNALYFVDDSIATNPDATAAALAAIDGPLAIILGGADKGHGFTGLADALARRGAIPICTGTCAPALAAACAAVGLRPRTCPTLREAVRTAIAALGGGSGTVLLSPACASTDQWHDYAERGDAFATHARELTHRPDHEPAAEMLPVPPGTGPA
ncbi:MAG: UDP-N-acetylmuramoyl-L-alanine--D-glutamate ligase [Planctomycetota bacterium]